MNKIAILGHQEVTRVLAESFYDKHIETTVISLCSNQGGKISEFVNLASFCEARGFDFRTVTDYSLKSEDIIEYFYESKFDVVFVVGWSRLIPECVLNSVGTRFIGWHGGPYSPPRCRGRAVVNWAILNNETDFFVYTMVLKPGVDDGDIIDIEPLVITDRETAQTLYLKCAFKLCDMMGSYIDSEFVFQPTKQLNDTATYLPKRSPGDGEIDWNLPARAIERLIRALSPPFPSAWTTLEGDTVFIKKARVLDYPCKKALASGLIYHLTDSDEFVVSTGNGLLLVEEYERAGQVTRVARGDLLVSSVGLINPTKIY